MQLPDIIITDRENKKKCSIQPLLYRPDLKFFHSECFHPEEIESFSHYIFLHVEGYPLTEQDSNRPLLILDASWRRAMKLSSLDIFKTLEKRSLVNFVTSYPRVSKLYAMPDRGLASVEALYAARLIQGREDISILEHYRWKEEFLKINQNIITCWRTIWG